MPFRVWILRGETQVFFTRFSPEGIFSSFYRIFPEGKIQQIWGEKFGTIISEEGDLPEHFSSTFSLVMRLFSNESEHIKLMISLTSAYCWKLSTCNHFHMRRSTNPKVTSILSTAIISLCAHPGLFQLRIYFSKFSLRFSVCNLATPVIHAVCFQILAAPEVWSILD